MRILDLEEGSEAEEPVSGSVDDGKIGVFNPKRAMVGVGARFLFYPTLLYNVLRNKIQVEFRWWDEVDQVCYRFFQFPYLVMSIHVIISFMN